MSTLAYPPLEPAGIRDISVSTLAYPPLEPAGLKDTSEPSAYRPICELYSTSGDLPERLNAKGA